MENQRISGFKGCAGTFGVGNTLLLTDLQSSLRRPRHPLRPVRYVPKVSS